MTNGQRVLEKIIKLHSTDKFKIAFCPYKAEMWDSMESVFDACVFEPRITRRICPIPFAEVDAQGNVGIMHDESSALKQITQDDDVFISDLDSFKPDFVVVHYPYDGRNKVTRIHEDFWSNNLKSKGYKIIYSPYGLPVGGVSSCNLIMQPVLKNADLIVCDCPEEKTNIINQWKTQENIDIDPDKILVTGSPKRDYLWTAEETGTTGTVLIAGSLLPLLNGIQKKILSRYAKIIEDELAVGHKVIYRYHPLSTSGIKAMCPFYYPQWLSFLGWCQTMTESHDFSFDTEWKIQNTMNQCDYMYADSGSAVALWIPTSKPYEVI